MDERRMELALKDSAGTTFCRLNKVEEVMNAVYAKDSGRHAQENLFNENSYLLAIPQGAIDQNEEVNTEPGLLILMSNIKNQLNMNLRKYIHYRIAGCFTILAACGNDNDSNITPTQEPKPDQPTEEAKDVTLYVTNTRSIL